MKKHKRLNFQRKLRSRRTRAKIFGTSDRPRLSVFRSNKFIYAQLIDDKNHRTLVAASDKELINGLKGKRLSKVERAGQLGEFLAEKIKKAKINSLIFDKGHYKYHGRVKAVAEAVRQNGLKF